jgi:hypothetical protein
VDHVRAGRIEVVLDRLARHRAAGDEIGLDGVTVVASPFQHRRWRPPRAVAIRGPLKVTALERAGVRFPVAHAYSDDVRRVRAELGDVEALC